MPASYLVWQLADSGFPAGGFAHSAGLEASLHHGHVTDAAGVWTFAQHALIQAGHSGLPLVTAVHRDGRTLADMDRLSDAFLTNPVANRASAAQGRTLLTSVRRSFPLAPIAELDEVVHREGLAGHYAPLFGAALGRLGVDLADTQRLFLFLAGRGVGSAAVRLGLIGAYEAQELQAMVSTHIDAVVERCGGLEPDDIAQSAPLVDLVQATHDRLYSRLFQS